MSELKYWLWLSALTGVRPRVKTLLLERYGSPRRVFYAPRGEYEQLGGLKPEECAALEDKDVSGAMHTIAVCEEKDITILTVQDAAYPRRLAAIYDPPAVLYVRGRLPAVDEEACIAVVGTRKASAYGQRMAYRMGADIVKCGGLVVSGLTAGVDSSAAEGALRAGGRCIAVLGTPIDGSFGGRLAEDCAASGAVVSEYPPGAQTQASFFRARNRISAGLSIAAVVVEAPERSGALLFADEAVSQGKEVFAVPGNADAYTAAGAIGLIRDGAKPVTCGWDVLCEFRSRFPGKLREASAPAKADPEPEPPETGGSFAQLRTPAEKKGIDKENDAGYIDMQTKLEGLSETELAILAVMTRPSMHIDDIIELSGLPAADTLSGLTMLQIGGVVRQEPGKRFSLNIRQK